MDGEFVITSTQFISLATTIANARQREVDDEFYRDVSAKTYHKWFEEPHGKSGKPRLSVGGYSVMSDGKMRYRMLKRQHYSMKRVGKKSVRYVPVKSAVRQSASLAERLMNVSVKYDVDIVRENPSAVTITMLYDKPVADYGNASAFYDRIDNGNVVVSSSRKGGRTSSVDRLIRNAIREWAAANQISCTIDNME